MPDIIEEPPVADRWWKRLFWFAGIWAASVAALGVVAMLLRWMISPD